MRIAKTTKRFRKDYVKLKTSGRRSLNKLHKVMEQLIDGKILNPIYRDHALHAKWQDFRDCHIEGDWILIYQIGKESDGTEMIIFCATDNHSNLFY